MTSTKLSSLFAVFRSAIKSSSRCVATGKMFEPQVEDDHVINLATLTKYVNRVVVVTPPPFGPHVTAMVTGPPLGITAGSVCKKDESAADADASKTPPKSDAKRGALAFLLKALIAAGMLFWTTHIGLWEDSDKTTALYESMYSHVMGWMHHGDTEEPQTPLVEDACDQSLQTSWNKGVVSVCTSIANAPAKLADCISKK